MHPLITVSPPQSITKSTFYSRSILLWRQFETRAAWDVQKEKDTDEWPYLSRERPAVDNWFSPRIPVAMSCIRSPRGYDFVAAQAIHIGPTGAPVRAPVTFSNIPLFLQWRSFEIVFHYCSLRSQALCHRQPYSIAGRRSARPKRTINDPGRICTRSVDEDTELLISMLWKVP